MQPTLYFPPDQEDAVVQYQGVLRLQPASEPPGDAEHPLLWYDGQALGLIAPSATLGAWVTTEEITKRVVGASLLARACDVGQQQGMAVLDAMAGWGVDGLELQLRGARVLQVERHPVAWALLTDLRRRFGLTSAAPGELRGPEEGSLSQIIRRHGGETLLLADATQVMAPANGLEFDVVYLDPMFIARKKSALPNKRLQLLASLVGDEAQGDDLDLAQWVKLAQRCAKRRVVVKRRLKDPPLEPEASWQYRGKAVRYDCFIGQS